jgi:hypothetical protein
VRGPTGRGSCHGDHAPSFRRRPRGRAGGLPQRRLPGVVDGERPAPRLAVTLDVHDCSPDRCWRKTFRSSSERVTRARRRDLGDSACRGRGIQV